VHGRVRDEGDGSTDSSAPVLVFGGHRGVGEMNEAKVVAAGSGIGATVFIAIGAGLLGSAPKSNDLSAEVLEFTSDHRVRLLASMWLLGFGFALALVFLIGLTAVAQQSSLAPEHWPTIALSLGIATFTLGAAALACVSSAAYRGDAAEADSVRLLWDLFAAITNASNIMTIFSSVAIGIMVFTGDALPRWIGGTSLLVAAAHLIASVSLAQEGALSPTGAGGQAAGFVYLAWMLATSVALVRAWRGEEVNGSSPGVM
jgi:hypothetical protein